MDRSILREFRALQLAIKGADAVKYNRVRDRNISPEIMELNSEQRGWVSIGPDSEVCVISLDKDCIGVAGESGVVTYLSISALSGKVLGDILEIMRTTALEIANREI
jgi:hypothetical protein